MVRSDATSRSLPGAVEVAQRLPDCWILAEAGYLGGSLLHGNSAC